MRRGHPLPADIRERLALEHGLGTVCLEDMAVVTEDGCEPLSGVSRKTW